MKLVDMIKIASDAYGDDGIVMRAHENEEDVGDTLAEFVALEISATYLEGMTDLEQLREARIAMQTACTELGRVFKVFRGLETAATVRQRRKAEGPYPAG